MIGKKFFKFKGGKLPLPVFFPDATRGVIKSIDTKDLEETKTQGILVNTFHLWQNPGGNFFNDFGGIRKFMNWNGAVISDSGGFQVMSVIKKGIVQGKITDEGIAFHKGRNKKLIFTPEESIKFQMSLGVDMVVVLDDFTGPEDNHKKALDTVERTISWAKRSKAEFEKICKKKGLTKEDRPYLLGVVQGGEFMDLREYCTKELVKIGFDGLGWGGWPFNEGKINFKSAEVIAKNSPSDYLLYGLGIGKPEDIVECVKLGFTIFDCVLPTRDARHGRLYVWDDKFYSYYDAKKQKNEGDKNPVSASCDCLLCKNYSRAYLYHLFKIGDTTALRLATIHNLFFYSTLMEKLRLTKI